METTTALVESPSAAPKAKTLTIHEIYHSIQGESSFAGWPCVFVRTTFCDLRCTYCDTAHAFYDGTKMMGIEFLTQNGGVYTLRVQKIPNVTTDGSSARGWAAM